MMKKENMPSKAIGISISGQESSQKSRLVQLQDELIQERLHDRRRRDVPTTGDSTP